jgi:hypothetical protein|tara:strand:- start:60 stop:314 length:255 start_codon:yes stop_codon:yes gene_type:complete
MANNMTDPCTTNFKIYGENRGIYYDETNRCIIYLANHECLADVYRTITHEVVHHCFAKLNISDEIDEDQEEKMIFFLAWADDSI